MIVNIYFSRAHIGREGFLFISTFESTFVLTSRYIPWEYSSRLWKNGVREPDIGKSEACVQISSRKIRKERGLYLHENHLTSNIRGLNREENPRNISTKILKFEIASFSSRSLSNFILLRYS